MAPHTIVLTNGRKDCLEQMFASYEKNVAGAAPGTIVDDSGDPGYRQYLSQTYRDWQVYAVADRAAGYSTAMQRVWALASQHLNVFLVEDDFVFTRPVDLSWLQGLLDTEQHLSQVVLLRQPWFPNEIEAGGLIQALQARGEDVTPNTNGTDVWFEHQATWSSNPTVFRGGAWVRQHPWPSGEGSEYRFGRQLVSEDYYFAYYGDDIEFVEHIGQRSGFGH